MTVCGSCGCRPGERSLGEINCFVEGSPLFPCNFYFLAESDRRLHFPKHEGSGRAGDADTAVDAGDGQTAYSGRTHHGYVPLFLITGVPSSIREIHGEDAQWSWNIFLLSDNYQKREGF